MYADDVSNVANAAKGKVSSLDKNPLGFFLSSMLAGIFVGFGVLLAFTIGGLLDGAFYTKIAMGLSFGIALSLVVIAGSELFTGNNMVMTLGVLTKSITLSQATKLWIICWLGNLLGSILLAFIFAGTGLASGDVGAFIAKSSATKMSIPFLPMITRGILCNTLVCLAVWCATRSKSESGKLIMIFWCLFAFITIGLEHSIANMTLFTIALLSPMGEAVSIGGFFYNLLTVTFGNMLGGIFLVAVPYYLISKKNDIQ